MRVAHVVGARPNFMKIAPLLQALGARPGFDNILIHTGQHYDHGMSGSFFEDLGIAEPDLNLGVGSGTHAEQTAAVMTAIEPVRLDRAPDLLVVVGDVNSTIASALTAAKLHVPVAHVEAGLPVRQDPIDLLRHRAVGIALARAELQGSRDDLEYQLGEPIRLFSYPYGRRENINEESRGLVRALGFRCCPSAHAGVVRPGADPFYLLRQLISPWFRSPWQLGFDLLFRS